MSEDLQTNTRPAAPVHFEHWCEDNRHRVGEIEPPADDQPDTGVPGRLMGTLDAFEAVAVDDR
ncbi:hypothetical protein FHT86_003370 [Rhizobium sp. BK313]|uniref:hypothetical protein n=1 Tax=Rhizobium sp. BK313 TaxID=2587081 RepID=UPI00105EE13D|nr:hypothetical protein [Rhizobium sp. BK313]MBB3455071.1 hypothetical protein [Rhizobium sp. BK313]